MFSDGISYRSGLLYFTLFFAAGALALVFSDGSGSLLRCFIGYPFIAVFPALLFFAAVSGNSMPAGEAFCGALIVGPVFSALLCAMAMLLGYDAALSVWSPFAAGAICGVAALMRRGKGGKLLWGRKTPGSGLKSIFSTPCFYLPLFALLATVPIIISMSRGPMMRLTAHGWFHASVAYKILLGGIPPEDPVFPGGGAHNYWFYHAWLAVLTRLFGRPPGVAIAVVNVHSFIAVIAGVWMAASSLFDDKRRVKMTALLLSIFGMNALGFVFLGARIMFSDKPFPASEYLIVLLRYMVPYGDFRLTQFLTKFMHANAFPMGTALYTGCLCFILRILRKGPERSSVIGVFLSTLGAFLFHPTSGLGLGISAGAAWLALLIMGRRGRLLWIAGALGAGALVAVPYLFAIFPFEGNGIHARPDLTNALQTLFAYALPMPLIIAGLARLWRRKDVPAMFTAGFFAGTALAAFFMILPGQFSNQYKFVRLLAVPAALVGAGAFIVSPQRLWKRLLLGFIALLAVLNTATVEYAYLMSPWARIPKFAVDGMNYKAVGRFAAMTPLAEWVRANTAADAVLVSLTHARDWLLLTQRSMVSPIDEPVSMGHRGADERRRTVLTIYGRERFSPADLLPLKKLGRPVYLLLDTEQLKAGRLPAEFDRYPQSLERVYKSADYRLYRFAWAGR